MGNSLQTTRDTIALLRDRLSGGSATAGYRGGVPMNMAEKAYTQALGLVYFDLEPVAKQLYPVITPLRNRIPRVKGSGGTATNWKAITAINTALTQAGVSEGNRSAVVTTTEQNFVKSYAGLGLEDYVTFEADYAAENFDDVRALAVENLLRAIFIQEEDVIIWGNGSSLPLGTPTVPTLAAIAGTGPPAGVITVGVVALTKAGFDRSSVAGGVPTVVNRTNADSTIDSFGGGSSNIATNTITTAGGNLTIQASVPVVKGAVAYAWFWSLAAGGAAGATLGAITTINSFVISVVTAGTGTQAANTITADNSLNSLLFDGFVPQALSTTGLASSQATGTPGTGTPLTADTAGGIVEIDADLKSFWDNRRLSPTEILVSSQEVLNITKKVVAGGGAPIFRFIGDWKPDQTGNITAGALVGSYLNKFAMGGAVNIPMRLHPNIPPGTIVYYTDTLPYPLSNVRNVIQMKTRREYYQIEWALRSRKYEYGVYVDELLQLYAPFAFGTRSNIGNG